LVGYKVANPQDLILLQATLPAIFLTGVCDYPKPGVEQQPPLGTWLDYGRQQAERRPGQIGGQLN